MFNPTAQEPPHKKREEEEALLSSIPDAVALSIFARVSRLDHAALSLVSPRYRSLVVSPDLYTTRSLMGCTEMSLYVCLSSPPPGPVTTRWLICRLGKPRDAKNMTTNRLCLLPSSPSQPSESSVVVLEWGIYVIGGKINGKNTSSVLVLDCRTHKWHQVSSMGVARASAAAGVVDGKIYVSGGCKDMDSWDPKTQSWNILPSPGWNQSHDLIRGSVVVDDNLYAVNKGGNSVYYSPNEGELLYCCDTMGYLFWCEAEKLKCHESEGMVWTKVKGLKTLRRNVSGYDSRSRTVPFDGEIEELPTSYTFEAGVSKLSNFGGNIVVFWDIVVVGLNEGLEIWCAEISLERREPGEIWGKIEWSEAVMTTDPLLYSPEVLHSVSVNI
ncbi:PREDICTED: putative F-box/kelch-repeat protein At3g24610 [Camelina sativa]|uniref:F-box/kelch-repeat protein At3g24610 n=1 Tax=Camelina sativa TaxID=90675 RepID=A0ABM0XSF2_CAMSA|nr:PREDICTED: putative F-box/kelch-repeat protein At3g24610 [Camelina sativa]